MKQSEYFDIGAEFKRGEPGYIISQSDLKTFAKDPWSWINGREVEETKSMEWGSLVDAIYLTPEELKELYALYPKTYPAPTKADPDQVKPWNMNSTFCKNWVAKQKKAGLHPVDRWTFDQAKTAVSKLLKSPIARALREGCQTQVCCQWEWTDPVTQITVPLKCLIDIVPDDADYLCDLKSTNDATISAFRRIGSRFRYDVQGAFYQWGYRETTRDTDAFAFILSESKKPYPVACYNLTPNDLHVGKFGGSDRWGERMGYFQMLQLYCRCLDSGHYPELNGGDMIPLNFYRD